jgi:hypothetical protein
MYRATFTSKDDLNAMIVKLMYSPKYQIEDEEEGEIPPHLQRWSDLTFLVSSSLPDRCLRLHTNQSQMYYYEVVRAGGGGQDKVPLPDYVLIDVIDNANTEAVIAEVVKRTNKAITAWPGVEFDTSSDAGKAILATVHGKAVSWLLASHKAQFGIATVTKVTLLGFSPQQFSMLFTIKRVESPAPPARNGVFINKMGNGKFIKAML